MTVLLLRLAGPLQAWGDSSRFVRRQTRSEPTKSGVLGLLAAAQGRRRTDEIEDLVGLGFGVRVDQPGRLIRDFQTAHTPNGQSMPLSYRFYVGDAVFLAAVEGDGEILAGLDEALRFPTFPLYLGRRSCPPAGPVSRGILDGSLTDVLQAHPWAASGWHQRRTRSSSVDLELIRDAIDADEHGELVRDVPVSFDPSRREYGWRTVVHEMVAAVPNLFFRESQASAMPPDEFTSLHEPMSLLGGG